jgi:hypothetical protein
MAMSERVWTKPLATSYSTRKSGASESDKSSVESSLIEALEGKAVLSDGKNKRCGNSDYR